MSAWERQDVRFTSGDAECAGWLYLPRDLPAGERRAAVVLGHGLGAIKEMGLAPYAERFCEAGYVVLVFDYRHFGDSGGEPRQLLDIERQRADWAAALAWVRARPEVEPARVAIFGSSFGGGHVLEVAARDHAVAAVIAQCPFTDGLASGLRIHPRGLPGVVARSLRDEVARLRGRDPVLVPLAGRPGEPALMNAPDVVPGYLGLVPEGAPFTNGVAARIATRILLARPGRRAREVRCPMLVAVCERDTVAPARATLRHVARAPRADVRRYPCGHFDVYTGEMFERVVGDYVEFLTQHVPPHP